jgi:hypothetical protein
MSQTLQWDFASVGAHRYWRIIWLSGGTTGNAWLGTLSFLASTAAGMTLLTSLQTLDVSVSKCRVLMEIDASATPVLNTDLTVEVTCDGGTSWTAAALTAVSSRSQGARSVVETADVTCTVGSMYGARIKTFNAKVIPIHGIGIAVH